MTSTTPVKESHRNLSPTVESPTTAQPLEFEDDAVENTASTENRSKPLNTNADDEQPPPQPPRPTDSTSQAEATLIEAFPSLDAKLVKAVLVASGGKLEPAFNALLSMSDPDFKAEPTAQRPTRPQQGQNQMESDELYARQLAAHYQQASTREEQGSRPRGNQQPSLRSRDTEMSRNEAYEDKDYSFLDDDLPVIRENVRKGFLETQAKVNKWITDFKKRIDGEDDDEMDSPPGASSYRPNQDRARFDTSQNFRRSTEARRRSGDIQRYDSDPRVLDDNFTELELRDEEAPPRMPPRPPANPDLFKQTPRPPQSGAVDEVEAAERIVAKEPSSVGAKTKKWQPLTSVAPEPVDADPFSLGDSDDEQESKTRDIKAEDTERLKKASAEVPAHEGEDKRLEPAERTGSSGTRDKDAEKMLTGK